SLKSTNFTLSSLVFALFLTSNAAYADNTVSGYGAVASGYGSTAYGEQAEAKGNGNTATGKQAKASGDNSTATGAGATATRASTATGVMATATSASTATGWLARATGDSSTATGKQAKATGVNSVALGANSNASNNNEVNIGIWWNDSTGTPVQTGTRTLSGLAAGVHDDEAVNVRQLNEVKENIAKTSGISREDAEGIANTAKGKAIEEANKNTTTEIGKLNLDAKLATADKNAKGYASDVLKSTNDKIERRAVSAENNAVTRSKAYTDERSDRTLESANIYTNHRVAQAENNAVARSNNYTDNRFSELRKNLEHTEKRLNAGIAGVTALSSIPYAAGNNFSYGIGAGNYQNGNAVAAGVQLRVSSSTNVRLNISWDSAGNNATGVGIAGGW
ncbi:TPA: YadA-like family protein, partial [Salmonella enterica subsp. enterica serovar Java]